MSQSCPIRLKLRFNLCYGFNLVSFIQQTESIFDPVESTKSYVMNLSCKSNVTKSTFWEVFCYAATTARRTLFVDIHPLMAKANYVFVQLNKSRQRGLNAIGQAPKRKHEESNLGPLD